MAQRYTSPVNPAASRLRSQSFLLAGSPDNDDDLFCFQAEDADPQRPTKSPQAPWTLLIVDDEPQVHEATLLTLRRGKVAGRPFRFLHAYSAAEAQALIRTEAQIDLILLDVVMETRDAGLRLVSELRGPMARSDLKILIRSGQPGFEKDANIRERYPVDGYIQKTEQTYTLMMDVIGSLLLGTSQDPKRAS